MILSIFRKWGYIMKIRLGVRKHKIVLVQETLAFCTVCKGGGGELTTECCGRPMTNEERNRVYKISDLDFVNGKWVNK